MVPCGTQRLLINLEPYLLLVTQFVVLVANHYEVGQCDVTLILGCSRSVQFSSVAAI